MSSAEEEGQSPYRPSPNSPETSNKKRKVARACDGCRSRKIRCDGPQKKTGEQCSNCATTNRECTYVTEAKKRGPPKGYIEGLEQKLAKMEDLLSKLAPGINIEAELEELIAKSRVETEANSRSGSRKPSPTALPNARASKQDSPSLNLLPGLKGEEYETSDDDACAHVPDVTAAFGDMTLDASISRRFHGKSSGLMLVQAAKDLKQQYSGPDSSPSLRREEFWSPTDWELEVWQSSTSPKNIKFPPEDLTPKLFDFFFRSVTPFLPVIHRPSFEAQFADGVHFRCPAFACVVLLVCAIGSKYSDDPRVSLEEAGPASAGWKYFIQVKELKKALYAPATLADLQCFVLVAYYLQSTSAPHSAWTILGIGIRCAQDVGAHRKKVYSGNTSLEDEQLKRVFWCLILFDRSVSSALGRPLACQDEDFDLDFPLEVDDDYWTSANEASPKQPAGVPSNISYFNSAIRLGQILAFALRTIYTINKSKVLLGFVGPQWEQHIVTELDSAMNKWVDSVPDHLRWDPARENQVHFEQSAMLYSSYYHLHILIHRPFIPSPRKPSILSFPSLAICTNAARSCSHVLDALRRRSEHAIPGVLMAAFTSGIVLLISIWGAKKTGVVMDTKSHLNDVGKCLRFLQWAEADWHSSGRMVDILRELASFGDLPLPEFRPPTTAQKRDRDYDTSSADTSPFVPPLPVDAPRPRKSLPKGRAKAPSSDTQQSAVPLPYPIPPEIHLTDPYQIPLPEPSAPLRDLASLDPSTFQHLPEQTQTWYDPNLASFANLVPPTSENGANTGYSVSETDLPSYFPVVEPAYESDPPSSNLPAWNGTDQQTYTTTVFGTYEQPTVDPVVHRTSCPSLMPVNSHDGLPMNIGAQSNFSGPEAQGCTSDSLGIWQGIPKGFEWQDWNDYFTTFQPQSIQQA